VGWNLSGSWVLDLTLFMEGKNRIVFQYATSLWW
jgi:hypothetical protein